MNIQDAILNGVVFQSTSPAPKKKGKKKKLSGAQQMRADYHARIAAKAAAREKRKALTEAKRAEQK